MPVKQYRQTKWWILGLFIWPFLIVAIIVSQKDETSYQQALNDHYEGRDISWYTGVHAPLSSADAAARSRRGAFVFLAIINVMVVSFMLMVNLFATLGSTAI